MRKYLINPLAQAEQCASVHDAEVLIKHVTECFEYLRPAIESRRALLLHDPRHDDRPLVPGQSFQKTLNDLSGRSGRDLRNRWLVYAKNRARKLSANTVELSQHAVGGLPAEGVSGSMDQSVLVEAYNLVSFGGSPLFESPNLAMTCGGVSRQFANTHCLTAIRTQLPCYKPSPKHGKKPYFDKVRKEHVAAMPLSEVEGQESLLRAVEAGGDYWSYHHAQKIFLRFKLTGGNVYHGFQVPLSEVPEELIAQLK